MLKEAADTGEGEETLYQSIQRVPFLKNHIFTAVSLLATTKSKLKILFSDETRRNRFPVLVKPSWKTRACGADNTDMRSVYSRRRFREPSSSTYALVLILKASFIYILRLSRIR